MSTVQNSVNSKQLTVVMTKTAAEKFLATNSSILANITPPLAPLIVPHSATKLHNVKVKIWIPKFFYDSHLNVVSITPGAKNALAVGSATRERPGNIQIGTMNCFDIESNIKSLDIRMQKSSGIKWSPLLTSHEKFAIFINMMRLSRSYYHLSHCFPRENIFFLVTSTADMTLPFYSNAVNSIPVGYIYP